MTDLLTPEEVRKMGISTVTTICLDLGVSVERLCHDYLTLWDRNEALVELLKDSNKAAELLAEDFASWVWDGEIK